MLTVGIVNLLAFNLQYEPSMGNLIIIPTSTEWDKSTLIW